MTRLALHLLAPLYGAAIGYALWFTWWRLRRVLR